MSFYTTVSMKDALKAKENGEPGADFFMACAQIPVYSVPASVFFSQSADGVQGPSLTITVTTTPIEPPTVEAERKIPALEEYNALPKDQKGHWECLHCGAPALGEAYMPGSYCSKICAYYGYL